MQAAASGRHYGELGVRRVVNAIGPWTRIGGSSWPTEIIDAMIDANSCYVELQELQEKAGNAIAELTGAEAAYVTSGAFSAVSLSVAACIAGKDPEKINRLPDTSDIAKIEVIHQTCSRYKYERAVTAVGAKLRLVGDNSDCRAEQIEEAICKETAAILFVPQGKVIAVSAEKVIEIGNEHGVPVIVDAPGNIYGSEMWVPGNIYPDEGYRNFARLGADLVCCGGKYIGAPQSVGYVFGKKSMIDAVALQSFVGYEDRSNRYRPLGRMSKLDRQLIVALVVALRRWKNLDHKLRLENAHKKKRYLMKQIATVESVKISEVPDSAIVVGFEVACENLSGVETSDFVHELLEGDPRIEVFYEMQGMVRGRVTTRPNSFVINVICLQDGDEEIAARRITSLLRERNGSRVSG